MNASLPTWLLYALGSAFFAALTAILAKVGIEGLNADLGTWIRTLVILAVTSLLVTARGEWHGPATWNPRGIVFLVLSGVATGASWLCYFRALQLAPASRVAPVDKLSVALTILLGVTVLGEPLSWKLVIGGALVVAGVLVLAL